MKIISRNYGSIPHLSISKMTQQADKKIERHQEELLTKKARDWKDLIIVTEKIDGSNVGVIRKEGRLIPITRKGYTAESSPFEQHHLFDKYIKRSETNFDFLCDMWRITGEWMIKTHGTKYNISNESPFCAFDIFDDNNKRLPYLEFRDICTRYNIQTTRLLHIGQPISIKNAIKLLGSGFYGNPDKPEGVVYRMEREGKVDFLAKWVHAEKEDGKYMKENIMNQGAVEFIGNL